MSNADKRSTHTDALETLGMIHFKAEARDAIHLAVEPVEAGQRLFPNDAIGINEGVAYRSGDREILGRRVVIKELGRADPFLNKPIEEGERFWLVVSPRKITSLRHVWAHPDFKEEA